MNDSPQAADLITEEQAAALCGYPLHNFRKIRYARKGPPFFRYSQRLVAYDRRAVIAWRDQHLVTCGS